MLGLTRENGELSFVLLALRYVDDQVYGPQESAGAAEEWGWIGNQRDAAAIGPFDDRLQAANGPLLLDGYGHRALIVRKLTTIWPEELPGAAPPFLSQLGAPPPNVRRSLIEVGHVTLRLRHINGGRQYVEELTEETVIFGRKPYGFIEDLSKSSISRVCWRSEIRLTRIGGHGSHPTDRRLCRKSFDHSGVNARHCDTTLIPITQVRFPTHVWSAAACSGAPRRNRFGHGRAESYRQPLSCRVVSR